MHLFTWRDMHRAFAGWGWGELQQSCLEKEERWSLQDGGDDRGSVSDELPIRTENASGAIYLRKSRTAWVQAEAV